MPSVRASRTRPGRDLQVAKLLLRGVPTATEESAAERCKCLGAPLSRPRRQWLCFLCRANFTECEVWSRGARSAARELWKVTLLVCVINFANVQNLISIAFRLCRAFCVKN